MSVVIAIKHKNKIYLGCDSQASATNLKYKLKGETQKIWSVPIKNNDLIVGGVGGLRAIQLLQVQPELFDKQNLLYDGLTLKHVITDLYDNIYNMLVSYRAVDLDSQGKPVQSIPSSFMFAYKDKCYRINHNGEAEEIDDFLVMGSGDEIAIGVLEANKNKSPEERIKEAIQACAKNTLYVDKDVKLLHT